MNYFPCFLLLSLDLKGSVAWYRYCTQQKLTSRKQEKTIQPNFVYQRAYEKLGTLISIHKFSYPRYRQNIDAGHVRYVWLKRNNKVSVSLIMWKRKAKWKKMLRTKLSDGSSTSWHRCLVGGLIITALCWGWWTDGTQGMPTLQLQKKSPHKNQVWLLSVTFLNIIGRGQQKQMEVLDPGLPDSGQENPMTKLD